MTESIQSSGKKPEKTQGIGHGQESLKTGGLKDALLFDEFSSILDKIASAFTAEEDKPAKAGVKVTPAQVRKEAVKPEVKVKRKDRDPGAESKVPAQEKPAQKTEMKKADAERPQQAAEQGETEQGQCGATAETETEAPAQEETAAAGAAQAAAPVQPGLGTESKNTEVVAEDSENEAPAEGAIEAVTPEVPEAESVVKQAAKEAGKEEQPVEAAQGLPVESQDSPLPLETSPEQKTAAQVEAAQLDAQAPVEKSLPRVETAAAAQAQTDPAKETAVDVQPTEDLDVTKILGKIEKAADSGSAAFSQNEGSNADVLAKLFENPVLQAERSQQNISRVIEYQVAMSHQALKPILELAQGKSEVNGPAAQAPVQQLQALSGADSSAALKNNAPSGQADKMAARAQLTKASAANTLERVESALKEAAKSKDGTSISLRLDPPSLGSVKVDVTLKDGALYARVVADSPQVNALLREKAHELQAVLRKAGVELDKVSVSVGSEQQSGQNDSQFTGKSSTERGKGAQSELGFGTSGGMEESAQVVQSTRVLDHWIA